MKHKILIIDAHPVYAPRMDGFLRSLTFQHIQMATTGEEDLAMLADFLPDAVVLSGMLPDMDSSDCCARLRAAHPTVKIIVQTGLFTELSQEEHLIRCGADAVLPRKEKDLQPLQHILEKLLISPVCPGSA